MSQVVRGGGRLEAAASTTDEAARAYLDHFWKVDALLRVLQQARFDPQPERPK